MLIVSPTLKAFQLLLKYPILFTLIFIFERESMRMHELGGGTYGGREGGREREREREREKERILNRLHAQHKARCGAQSYDPGIMS